MACELCGLCELSSCMNYVDLMLYAMLVICQLVTMLGIYETICNVSQLYLCVKKCGRNGKNGFQSYCARKGGVTAILERCANGCHTTKAGATRTHQASLDLSSFDGWPAQVA